MMLPSAKKMPQEMGITQDASKRLWVKPFRTKVASFTIVATPMVRVSWTLLGLCVIVSWVMPLVHLRFQPNNRLAQAVAG
jgi:hypothetical protein